jgi:mannose-1-phosphate guanylyltransferase
MSGHLPPVRRGLLLAGGYGSRLRPLTDKIPKCLVPIGGQPLLYYWLRTLFDQDSPFCLDRVIINTHYLPQQVEAFVKSSPWASRVDLAHEVAILGTAGTLRLHREYFDDVPFLVAHADNLTLFSLQDFQNAFLTRPDDCVGTMMTFQTDQPSQCGIVELDSRGLVTGYYEKMPNPPGALANAAVFIFDSHIHEILARHQDDLDLCGQTVPRLIGRLNTYNNYEYHRDIGTPHSYETAISAVESGLIRLN